MSNQGFEALVNQYSRQVLNTALRILRNAELAHDVHQEVFLAIWQRWHKYDGQIKWDAYLYRTTVRKAIKLARKTRTQANIDQQPDLTKTEKNNTLLETAELQQELARCLAKLPKRQADVFVLSKLERLEYKKIAQLLGCSQNTVRVHLHRAIKRLAHELKDYLPER